MTVPTLSTERLEEILAGCEGVTPGPWFTTGSPWFQAGDGVLAGSPDGNIAYLLADCDDGMNPRDEYIENGGSFPLGDKDADAAHIARLDPQTISEIITRLLAAEAILDMAEGALRKIEETGTVESTVRVGDMYADNGYETYTSRSEAAEIARTALTAIHQAKGTADV